MDYGYDKQNRKVLYRKKKIPNCFHASLFSKHKQQYEGGELSKDFSRLYCFLPTTTDSVEKINQHRDQVFLKPIDIKESEFGEGFNPSMLDSDYPEERKKTREVVFKVLKIIASLINSSLPRNAVALLSKSRKRKDILWAREERLLERKVALTY